MFKTTLKIDGMMCGMCEAHINDVIRKQIPDAKKVKSSYIKGESVFISGEAPSDDELTAAIAETGYVLTDVKSELYKKKFLGFI